MITDKSVDEYIQSADKWKESLVLLRSIFLSVGLNETIKWGAPVFTSDSKNIAGMSAFKNHVAVWFYQGALLMDEKKKLVNAQEGVTKALRQWRFGSVSEIRSNMDLLRVYIREAIENEKQGKKIKPQKDKPLVIPDELRQVFGSNPELKKCFDMQTLSKRRDFAEYISGAKQHETRQKRMDKIIPLILQGMGLNDKYLK
jgi:uncharacterized protein YdeI (YjbR/CyaY-like superfamily)